MLRTERQAHGFIFQGWVFRKFLKVAYSGEWDIPEKINPLTHKPVSIKTSKWDSGGIGLGDVLNQFDINEDFEILVAFYEQKGNKKKVVNMQLIPITKDKWREMWGNLTRTTLEKFDDFVRSPQNRHLSGQKLNQFRANVQQMKKNMLSNYTGKIIINPKIDSKNQRRVQCSLGFDTLVKEFNINSNKMKNYTLWGEDVKLNEINLD